jgi:hypothetical protein
MSNDHKENEYTKEVDDGVSGVAGGDMWATETRLSVGPQCTYRNTGLILSLVQLILHGRFSFHIRYYV